jgi:hypothetical protein
MTASQKYFNQPAADPGVLPQEFAGYEIWHRKDTCGELPSSN